MNAITLASRAVLARYATKVLRPIEVVAIGLFIALLIGTVLLITYVSAWWWLMMILVIAYGIFGSVAWLVLHYTIDQVRPEQTPHQTEAVDRFIGHSEKIADTLQMTQFGLILRVIRDVMGRKDTNVLTDFTENSKGLKEEFEHVIKTFL